MNTRQILFVSIAIIWMSFSSIALCDEIVVNTGIANTGKMTIEGDVSIDVKIESRVDDLVAVLEYRAKIIKEYLRTRYKDNSPEFISQFEKLHQEHVVQLKAGNFVAAHELLIEIHKLSFLVEMQREEVILYFCVAPHYIRGTLIQVYVGNDFSTVSNKYALSITEQSINNEGLGCGPSYEMAEPINLNQIYTLILNTSLNDDLI